MAVKGEGGERGRDMDFKECGGNRSICQDVVCFLMLLLLKGKAPQLDTLLAGVKAQNMPMVQLLLHRKADVNGQETKGLYSYRRFRTTFASVSEKQ